MKIDTKSMKWLLAEFVVVVIGILVALAVDDYRGNRAALATERFLLTELRDDLNADLEELAQIIEDAKRRQSAGSVIRKLLGADPARNMRQMDTSSEAQSMSPMDAIGFLGNTLDFDVTTRTFDQMNRLDSFQTIQSRILGQSIVAYYSAIAGQNLVVDLEVRLRIRLMTLLERSGIARFDSIDDDYVIQIVRQDPELAAVIRNIESHAAVLIRDFERFDRRAKELVLKIDAHLSDR